ncbi:hypothetical protein T265_10599 [Opisthorchis viverrini]|uniref:Uncharacterized protein n=1 Tax=Opisthorchis viverrini TaxID=6198 RepID=A0A074Z5Z1_OPIVI|nr:hypothetical protein T265_10599 [Opisthorchis viverrini]KER20967.1 hypothetical protein T265_10599 [Opisthorchis viverrini]
MGVKFVRLRDDLLKTDLKWNLALREGWKGTRGGQTMTWQRSGRAITSKLSCVDHCRIPGWEP